MGVEAIVWPVAIAGAVVILVLSVLWYAQHQAQKSAREEAKRKQLEEGEDAQERQDAAMVDRGSDLADDAQFLQDDER
jgi:cbb3-type cytochrome oxidase subunit 3